MNTLAQSKNYWLISGMLLFFLFAAGCGGTGKNEKKDSENESSSPSVSDMAKEAGNMGDQSINVLTESEKKEGWQLLFDGETTEHWRGAHKDHFPEKGWKVQDGLLMVMESGGDEAEFGGDIVTKEEYENFEFKVDFKITEGANSGIKYYVTENYEGEGSAIGLEYQILDDQRHPDANKGRNGNRTLASLYDLIPAEDKNVNPVGEWNHARIVSKDNQVEHWLNGEKVLEYNRNTEEFRDLVQRSKYKVHENFGEWDKGHILLQDHGNRVYYRNIKVKPL